MYSSSAKLVQACPSSSKLVQAHQNIISTIATNPQRAESRAHRASRARNRVQQIAKTPRADFSPDGVEGVEMEWPTVPSEDLVSLRKSLVRLERAPSPPLKDY